MKQRLIICFQADQLEHASWLLLDDEEQVKAFDEGLLDHRVGDLAKDVVVQVLLPAKYCLLASVVLPLMSQARLEQAVPYALEEQLLDDPENLHFALGAQKPDGSVAVVVIAKAILSQYLALLERAGIDADVIAPLSLAIPYHAESWQGIYQDEIVVRTGESQAFCCAPENLASYLDLAAADQSSNVCHLDIHSQLADLQFSHSEAIGVTVLHYSPQAWLAMLARQTQHPTINLLGGAASSRRKYSGVQQFWFRLTLICSLALFVALLLYPLVSYVILHKQVDSLDTKVAAIYKKHFPGSKSVIAPRRRMEDRLRQTAADLPEDPVFVLLYQVAKAKTAQIDLKQLRYQSGRLHLDVAANDTTSLNDFSQQLMEKGLSVKQTNVNATSEAVTASLEVQ